ncbi:methylmalonyl CoA epimerase (predicted), isoform CRA_d [Rattus norvegicus]|uniref:Methylmalonyl-CoA epimerase, mitochondrial n=1 Tax=Rattus norvegicus TaxID=10116 RepID=A6JBL4_RAT|nr:methylmalonyl-CoA epimerase, mitochondrial [Rattus norvegicus]EDM08394.1 methylmalonyl CoA epimerase (predicted), isoform CRA_d [Rattus norvegicus]|eukprot:NP_001099811.1 methylmalonyl-CoA epimerase, mitochondrial [Rattus norvegicus]
MRLVVKAAALAAGATGLFSRVQTPVAAGRSFSTSPSQHQASSPVWKLGRLNHVAIAVPDLEKASSFYRDVLGAQVSEAVPLPEHGVSVVFVNLGNTKMELLHPLGSDSPIAGFLQKNKAGGMHHVCIEVDNINAAVMDLKKQKIRSLSDEAKIGAHGKPVIFLHPKDCGGVLVELEQA